MNQVAIEAQPADPASNLDLRNTTQPERAVSLKEAWNATISDLGPVTDKRPDDEPAAPAATEAAREETEPAEAKAEPKKAPKAKAKEPEPEETAADDEPKVSPRDLIEARRRQRELYQRRERELDQAYRAKIADVDAKAARLAPLMKVAEAIDAGDFDAIAQGLGEFSGNTDVKDWNSLNGEALKAMQSPVYKRMRELEKRQEGDRRARAERDERDAREQAERARTVEVQNWKRDLVDQLVEADDPALVALAEKRPQLADFIFNIQNAHYTETGGEVLPANKAAERAIRAAHDDFKWWSEFFEENAESPIVKRLMGDRRPSPKTENGSRKTETSENGNRKAATSERRGAATAPKNVSHTRAAEPVAVGQLEGKALIKHWATQIEKQDHIG